MLTTKQRCANSEANGVLIAGCLRAVCGQCFVNERTRRSPRPDSHTHTHIHTHAHKYTYKYIDIHIHRQTECRGVPVRCVLLQRPFPAYFSMRLPHIHNTPQDRLLQSPHTPTRTHTRTHIPPGFFGRRRPQGPNELKPCFLGWGPHP